MRTGGAGANTSNTTQALSNGIYTRGGGHLKSWRRGLMETKFYDDLVEQHGAESVRSLGWGSEHSRDARLRVIADHVGAGSVLDVGCGHGDLVQFLSPSIYRYTGIDIRNGTQLECVHCTACIDACDNIMERINKPKGLIRYASESTIADNKPFTITSRLKAYIVLLIALLAIWLVILTTRSTVEIQVRKTPGKLYYETNDGRYMKMYNVILINKSHNDFDSLYLKIQGEK
jgi:ferredoxin